MTSQSPSPVTNGTSRHSSVFKGERNHVQKPSTAIPPVSPGVRSIKPPRVFARLQAFFPPSFPFPQSPASPPDSLTKSIIPPLPPQFLKARIITWNMHDSLPKGDLEELLGSVPLYTPRNTLDESERIRIPGLSMEDGHPYHIIVVAGQECPTLSGIPLGLAANFKHRDPKDREKEEMDRDGGKEKDLLHQTKHLLSKHLKPEHTSPGRSLDPPRSGFGSETPSSYSPVPPSGWSAVLEDWFAKGVGSLHDVKPVVTRTSQKPAELLSSSSSPGYQLADTVNVDWKPSSALATSNTFPISNMKTKMGPYELLIKERLMGIYTAVYIHRDVRPLVRGVSTGAVPAGLIGGRLGNKGGVGVSINLYGTTLLFINAHLAAHEGKVSLRVANLAKIKAELPLESWLAPDDPRTFAEDLTNRFDHSWIFGDLNFRLDISRLHADWLISRKEYSQAFEFDQLHKLMDSGEGTFTGFNEAKIDFPPTFKYDVMRTMKREKSKHARIKVDSEEKDRDTSDPPLAHNVDEEQSELGSLHSSAWTSIHSRLHTDPTEDGNDSDLSLSSPPETHSPRIRIVSRAALKAKAAWIGLLDSSRDFNSPDSPKARKKSPARLGIPGSAIELSRSESLSQEPRFPILRRAVSSRTPLTQPGRDELGTSEDDKGVYDSSSKKRVPSWCDRILWKSTVESPEGSFSPEAVVDQEAQSIHSGGRPNRVGQLLHQAFRPRPLRDPLSPESPTDQLRSRRPSGNQYKSNLNISKHTQSDSPAPLLTSPGLYQSKSLEPSPAFDGSALKSIHRNRSASATADILPRRQSMPVYSRTSRSSANSQHTEIEQVTHPENLSGPSASPVSQGFRLPSKRWFLKLLTRDHTHLPITADTTNLHPSHSAPPIYQKGDVVCLSYRTLDDGQMRRLEGRSDHRPVIGSYAIHI